MKNFLLLIWGLMLHAGSTYVVCFSFLVGIHVAFGWEPVEGFGIYTLRLSALWYGIFLLLNHFKQNLSVK